MAGLREAGAWLREATRPLRRRIGLRRHVVKLADFLTLRRALARRRRVNCPVIGITGSSGKSTVSALLTHVLAANGKVSARVHFNTIISIVPFLARLPKDTDFVVVETGVEAPGNMAEMVNIVRPTMGIVTTVGRQHYSAFRSQAAIADEKGILVEALPADGLAILNSDEPLVMAMAARTRARIVTFGHGEDADYRVIAASAGIPQRLGVTIACAKGEFVITTPFLDESFWLATASGFAAAVELGVDPHEAVRRIASLAPLWNRLALFETEGGPTFLLDTIKAPAESLEPSFAAVRKARTPGRKTIVLGSISDYSGKSRKQYRTAYQMAREAADRVIFVGETMYRARVSDEDRDSGAFAGFYTTREAAEYVRATAQPGELILLKGSPKQHLERIALMWTNPVQCWEMDCGLLYDCKSCGLFEIPFEQHHPIRRAARRERRRFWKKQPEAPPGQFR